MNRSPSIKSIICFKIRAIINFLVKAGNSGVSIKAKIGLEGLLNLDNLFIDSTNPHLKERLRDLKTLIDFQNHKKEGMNKYLNDII